MITLSLQQQHILKWLIPRVDFVEQHNCPLLDFDFDWIPEWKPKTTDKTVDKRLKTPKARRSSRFPKRQLSVYS
jgi:hypothetical protein